MIYNKDNPTAQAEIKPVEKYLKMRTITRMNYRSSCDFTAGSIVGVLENKTEVPTFEDFYEFHNGHYWRKIKLGRKHYFAVADWLKAI